MESGLFVLNMEFAMCPKTKDLKVYKIQFYREMLCEVEVQAESIDQAEMFFREGVYSNDIKRVGEAEIVDELVSVEASSDSSTQITFIN